MRPIWRDPRSGKHHVAPDSQTALCGQPIHGFWVTETGVRWADEDCCKRCLAKTAPAQQPGTFSATKYARVLPSNGGAADA